MMKASLSAQETKKSQQQNSSWLEVRGYHVQPKNRKSADKSLKQKHNAYCKFQTHSPTERSWPCLSPSASPSKSSAKERRRRPDGNDQHTQRKVKGRQTGEGGAEKKNRRSDRSTVHKHAHSLKW